MCIINEVATYMPDGIITSPSAKKKFKEVLQTELTPTYIVTLILVLVLMPILIIVVVPRIKESRRIRDYSSASEACSAINIDITRVSSPILYIDTSITPSPVGMYAAYAITNNSGSSYSTIWVKAANFQGPAVSLGSHEDGITTIDSLAPSGTTTVFFYLTASEEVEAAENHDISLYESDPSGGADILCSTRFSLTTKETIKARANKVLSVSYTPEVPEVGSSFTMQITGRTGVIGHDRIFAFTPISYVDWPADTFELTSSTITLTGGNEGVHTNTLILDELNTPDSDYVIEYTFDVLSTTLTPTPISPESYISSGQPIKHTDTSTPEYFGLAPINEIVSPSEEDVEEIEEQPVGESDTPEEGVPDGEEVTEEPVEEDVAEEGSPEEPVEDIQEEEEVIAEDTTDVTEEQETVTDTTPEGEPSVTGTEGETEETLDELPVNITEQNEPQEESLDGEIIPSTETITTERSAPKNEELSLTEAFFNADWQQVTIFIASTVAGATSAVAALLLIITRPLRPMGVFLGGENIEKKERHAIARRLCAKHFKMTDVVINEEKEGKTS